MNKLNLSEIVLSVAGVLVLNSLIRGFDAGQVAVIGMCAGIYSLHTYWGEKKEKESLHKTLKEQQEKLDILEKRISTVSSSVSLAGKPAPVAPGVPKFGFGPRI